MTDKLLFKESKNENLWAAIRDDEAYASFRENLSEAWKFTEEKTFLPLEYEMFTEYMRGCNSNRYGKEYYGRRLGLNASFMSYMIYREEKYLKKLEEIIMLILGEYTWAVPAHIKELTDCETVSTFIDLFAAETGHALSEILYILGDKLDVRIQSRIRYEIDRRIISSILKNRFHFEESVSNWATVCAGSVGMTFLYMAPEKFSLIRDRIISCINNYIGFFGNDGACAEGAGYWLYGFGYYIYFEELYKEFSGSYLVPMTEKQKKIAMFLQKVHINGNRVISFSDCNATEFLTNGIVCRVNEIFGDDVKILPEDAYAPPVMGGDNCYRFAHCIRNFLWHNPKKMPKTMTFSNEKIYLEDAQWYIRKTNKYFFAAKGGGNSDPHNHNDVGSFIVSDYTNQLLADLGKGEYDKFYFNPETRYNNLCCSSRGHSLPIVDGIEQSPGESFRAKSVEQSDNRFRLDIADAYDDANLMSLVRTFDFAENAITLTDEISQKCNTEWISRLVSTIEPCIEGTNVVIGNMKIQNNLDIVPEISVGEVTAHSMDGLKYPVYLIDYKTSQRRVELKFEF